MSGFNDELLDGLPIEFWDYYSFKTPSAYGDYKNLWWQEWLAINAYFLLNDESLLDAIHNNKNFNTSEGMNNFIYDKSKRVIKRPPRMKKSTLPLDIEIYNIIERRSIGTSQNKAVKNLKDQMPLPNHKICLAEEGIISAHKRGKKYIEDLHTALIMDVIKQYKVWHCRNKDWLSLDDDEIDRLIEKYNPKSDK